MFKITESSTIFGKDFSAYSINYLYNNNNKHWTFHAAPSTPKQSKACTMATDD